MQAVLLALATAATCTVADAERKHGHHKALASNATNLSFISLMTNSVADEARHLYLSLQRQWQKLGEQVRSSGVEKRKLDTDHKNGAGEALVKKNTNAKDSPIGVFRRQYIASKGLAGVKQNWVNAASWEEVKTAFDDLAPGQRVHFQQLASCLNTKRCLAKRKPNTASGKEVSVGVDDIHTASSKSIPAEAILKLRPPALNISVASDFRVEHLSDCISDLEGGLVRISRSSTLDPWPISETAVFTSLLSLRCRGVHIKDAAKNLSRTCQFLAGPKSEEFPDKVRYIRSCQHVCHACWGTDFVQLQAKVANAAWLYGYTILYYTILYVTIHAPL